MGEPLSLWYLASGLAIAVAVLIALPIVLTGVLFYLFLRNHFAITPFLDDEPQDEDDDYY
ncbi:MAG: hypothetical protein OQK82_02790 [Candidatus Pacearchaeota archaeon]|nr:hypothetical protein [Candidatus Pacearchaeota archaeon]